MPGEIPDGAYAIIIGAMKCGTSSLYNYLEGHPEICPALVKEPEFFSENQRHGVDVTEYRDLWSFDPSVHKYALEASTGYTKFPSEPNVPDSIHNLKISPKFIYIIRNPFDRIRSHLMHLGAARGGSHSARPLIDTSNYYLQLEQYQKHFPLETILLVDFDDLKDNPRLVLERVYAFLGLSREYFPDTYAIKNRTKSETRLSRFLRRWRLTSQASSERLESDDFEIAELRAPAAQRAQILTDSERRFIHDALEEDMQNLHRVHGFDVRKWGFEIGG